MTGRKQRLLVFIVAYNAEQMIEAVLRRIPRDLGETYDVEVLIIDDSSQDGTFERGYAVKQAKDLPFTLHVLFGVGSAGGVVWLLTGRQWPTSFPHIDSLPRDG